jgi:hypothetical protein
MITILIIAWSWQFAQPSSIAAWNSGFNGIALKSKKNLTIASIGIWDTDDCA